MSHDWDFFEREVEANEIVRLGYYDYDWNILVVAKRPEDGRLFMYSGAGCSCNSPSAEVGSWDDMIRVLTPQHFLRQVDEAFPYEYGRPRATEIYAAAKKVDKALRGK